MFVIYEEHFLFCFLLPKKIFLEKFISQKNVFFFADILILFTLFLLINYNANLIFCIYVSPPVLLNICLPVSLNCFAPTYSLYLLYSKCSTLYGSLTFACCRVEAGLKGLQQTFKILVIIATVLCVMIELQQLVRVRVTCPG